MGFIKPSVENPFAGNIGKRVSKNIGQKFNQKNMFYVILELTQIALRIFRHRMDIKSVKLTGIVVLVKMFEETGILQYRARLGISHVAEFRSYVVAVLTCLQCIVP
ncbi:hypothetical protein AVEN_262220-1 [Araneus ventricosus]|uniref:Uncharacterized protein n=1 Tax=Araneus ventricosus TaxID=182803 RepID=A0A4Y2GBY5_ARAVE|nr:hypothetical protein AVEN_262220-1 [Araneus ventricosus]